MITSLWLIYLILGWRVQWNYPCIYSNKESSWLHRYKGRGLRQSYRSLTQMIPLLSYVLSMYLRVFPCYLTFQSPCLQKFAEVDSCPPGITEAEHSEANAALHQRTSVQTSEGWSTLKGHFISQEPLCLLQLAAVVLTVTTLVAFGENLKA